MNKITVTKDNAYIGMKVVRGRDWGWGNQDYASKFGTIIKGCLFFPINKKSFWVSVKWENGEKNTYRIGEDSKFDLYVYEDKKKETLETVTLSIHQMNEIIKMACDSWKNILREEFWEAISNQKELVITKKRFQEYLDASTPRQWYKFKELFPEQFKPVLPNIKPGTLVYINQGDIWYMKFFSHFDERGRLHAFNNQKKHGDTTPYDVYSLTNPLEK